MSALTITTISDLKRKYRQERLIIKFRFVALFFLFLLIGSNAFSKIIIGLGLLHVIFMMLGLRRLSKIPGIPRDKTARMGNFSFYEIETLVNDVLRKMKFSGQLEIKLLNEKHAYMGTTVFEKQHALFVRKNWLLISEGLLSILSYEELRAVIAHEVGHHLAPKSMNSIVNEYWADYYACKYDNPVALANALLKIDQHEYFLNVFLQRSCHLAETFLGKMPEDKEFGEFLMQHATLPLCSKNDANNQAKQAIELYRRHKALSPLKHHFLSRILFLLKKRMKRNILQRKELAKRRFVHWAQYDTRLIDNYLDKYELLALYYKAKTDPQITLNRAHFLDKPKATHPNTNRRIIFIIENFLSPQIEIEKMTK